MENNLTLTCWGVFFFYVVDLLISVLAIVLFLFLLSGNWIQSISAFLYRRQNFKHLLVSSSHMLCIAIMLFKETVWFTSLGLLTGGAAGVVSRITGSVGKGLAAITMDKEYQQKRREEMGRQPKDFGDSLARGGKGLLLVSLLQNLQEILTYRYTLAYVLVVWHVEHCL